MLRVMVSLEKLHGLRDQSGINMTSAGAIRALSSTGKGHLHTPALFAEVKIIPIGPAGGKRNHPIYRHSPPGVLRPEFLC
jgi:hypothetical protein